MAGESALQRQLEYAQLHFDNAAFRDAALKIATIAGPAGGILGGAVELNHGDPLNAGLAAFGGFAIGVLSAVTRIAERPNFAHAADRLQTAKNELAP